MLVPEGWYVTHAGVQRRRTKKRAKVTDGAGLSHDFGRAMCADYVNCSRQFNAFKHSADQFYQSLLTLRCTSMGGCLAMHVITEFVDIDVLELLTGKFQ